MKKKSHRRSQPLAYSIECLEVAVDVGRTKIFEEIAAGRLIANKVGSRTIVTRPNVLRWLRSLPTTLGREETAIGEAHPHEIESPNKSGNVALRGREGHLPDGDRNADPYSSPKGGGTENGRKTPNEFE